MNTRSTRVSTRMAAAALAATLVFTGCGSGSGGAERDAEVTTTSDDRVVDHIVADVSPDGLREESGNRIGTSGAKAEMPPDWPADLAVPEDFVLASGSWNTAPSDGEIEQKIVGHIPGAEWNDVYQQLLAQVQAAGYGDIEQTDATDPAESRILKGVRGDERIVYQVGAPVVEGNDNLITLQHVTKG